MCIFSAAVEHVSATKIFARALGDDRQVLVYAMDFAASGDVAMILPLPVPVGARADAVRFVDLSGYGDFFDDVKRAFPATMTFAFQPLGRGGDEHDLLLEVHQVGAFEASFVPSVRDFARLDPRFRIPASVAPIYADWGFAVFQLRPGERATVHPMALVFPQREPGTVFFPTVHVHDGGALPATAMFDHTLYAQLSPVVARLASLWTASSAPLGRFVDATRAQGLVDGGAAAAAHPMFGPAPNRDVWMRAPVGVALEDLAGGGATYAYEIRATYAFAEHHQYPRWSDTARRLAVLCANLPGELAALVERQARAWQLAPLTDALPPHFMNGPQLWRGTSYMHGSPQLEPGPGHVTFTPFTQQVEPQAITLGFAEIPTREDAVAIDRALGAALDRALDRAVAPDATPRV